MILEMQGLATADHDITACNTSPPGAQEAPLTE